MARGAEHVPRRRRLAFDPNEMTGLSEQFGIELKTVREYAREVLAGR